MKKSVILLFLIVLLASILRLWKLGSVPASPDWDEAALGYNAYSILHTAHDEYGKFLPIVFRSFDDYKPGLYIYLVVPFVQLFGLSVWATRLPSALFGILTVLSVYFLIKELTGNTKLGLLTAFLLAISPWHIQFSRVAFETNVGLSLNIFAATFFLKALKKPLFLFPSVFFIALSPYVYQSEKVFSPLFFLTLIIIYHKQLFALPRKYLISACIFGLLIAAPIFVYTLTDKDALARAKGVSIFSESTEVLKNDVQRLQTDQANYDKIGIILDNRRLVFAKEIVANYLSHLDFNWLFITGDIARHHAPDMGLLYIVELPFILSGMYLLFFGKYDKKTKWFVGIWVLLAPVPASVTTGVPHAVRTLNFLPTFQLFSAIGLLSGVTLINKNIKYSLLKYVIYLGVLSLFIVNITYYLDQYFVQQNYYNSEEWQYGYAEAVPYVNSIQSNYQKIIVSNQPYMDQSYIFFLFYLKYNPAIYQDQTKNVSGGFRENHTFGKFEFRPINWSHETDSKNVLYVGRASDFPSEVNMLKSINFLDNNPAMKIVKK